MANATCLPVGQPDPDEQYARRFFGQSYTECPQCGSRDDLEFGVDNSLVKPKPYVACRNCGALLAWG